MKSQKPILITMFVLIFMLLASYCFGQVGTKDFGKPVYLHKNRSSVIKSNKALRTYRHLTQWHVYEKRTLEDGTKIGFYNPAQFKQRFIDMPESSLRDFNDQTLPMSFPLDLELHDTWKTGHPDWMKWTDEYRAICKVMQAAGHKVQVYGSGLQASEFQNHWVTYRELFRGRAFWRAEEAIKKRANLDAAAIKLANRFRDVVDVAYIRGYTPYEIPSIESWQMGATLYDLQQRAARVSMAYGPDFPTAVWLQPNYTAEEFKPIPLPIWNRIFEYCLTDPNIDEIYIWSFNQDNQVPGFWESFSAN